MPIWVLAMGISPVKVYWAIYTFFWMLTQPMHWIDISWIHNGCYALFHSTYMLARQNSIQTTWNLNESMNLVPCKLINSSIQKLSLSVQTIFYCTLYTEKTLGLKITWYIIKSHKYIPSSPLKVNALIFSAYTTEMLWYKLTPFETMHFALSMHWGCTENNCQHTLCINVNGPTRLLQGCGEKKRKHFKI